MPTPAHHTPTEADRHRAAVLREGAAAADQLTWQNTANRNITIVGAWYDGLDAAVRLLQRMADESGKDTPDGGESTRTHFFTPGHTYGPSYIRFRCDAITTHPATGDRQAIGWFRFTDNSWKPANLDADDWANGSWTEDTESGEDRQRTPSTRNPTTREVAR